MAPVLKRREIEQLEIAQLLRSTNKTSDELSQLLGYHPVVIRQWICGYKSMSSRARKVVRAVLQHSQ